jgi:hypothetical protein
MTALQAASPNASATSRPGRCPSDAASLEPEEVLVEGFGWCLVAEGLAGAAVKRDSDGVELDRGVLGEVGAFREVLAQQAVGVLVRSALPGTLEFRGFRGAE